MRSQKQNNRSPRPFKSKFNERGWSGGNKGKAATSSPVRSAKPKPAADEKKADEPESSSGAANSVVPPASQDSAEAT